MSEHRAQIGRRERTGGETHDVGARRGVEIQRRHGVAEGGPRTLRLVEGSRFEWGAVRVRVVACANRGRLVEVGYDFAQFVDGTMHDVLAQLVERPLLAEVLGHRRTRRGGDEFVQARHDVIGSLGLHHPHLRAKSGDEGVFQRGSKEQQFLIPPPVRLSRSTEVELETEVESELKVVIGEGV